jgi:4-carboxymuconolactone decarboxylase
MSRLRDLHRDELDAPGLEVWDLIVGTRGAQVVSETGVLTGPFNALVHAPDVGRNVATLGAVLRFGTAMDRRLTEVAILTVASRWKAEFEWWAHARLARELGIPDAVVDAIGRGEEPPFAADDERIVHTVARELTTAGRVTKEHYDAAAGLLGESSMVELISLCGYYSLISFLLNSFEVPLPPGVQPNWASTAPDGASDADTHTAADTAAGSDAGDATGSDADAGTEADGD